MPNSCTKHFDLRTDGDFCPMCLLEERNQLKEQNARYEQVGCGTCPDCAQLKEENERLKELDKMHGKDYIVKCHALTASEQKRKELWTLLNKSRAYLKHVAGCFRKNPSAGKCDCKLWAFKKEVATALEGVE